ncbi:MAG TPA: 3-phosphoshikimate 1-carboxyvinyltransferase [Candidatus Limnocylindria bacterium]|nr:3-phosphoshikimate 1-carboxyvinyltransferase [Candidatus Limnocylindria bacterium]
MTVPRTGIEVRPAARLEGELRLPGDKSISHRALMLAILADGESTVRGAGDGADVRSTAGIAAALGAEVESAPGDGPNVDYLVRSGGADALREPAGTLDCGNSGTSLRLFAGILAGQPIRAILDGDASLRTRPVARIIEPLRSMGATLEASDGDTRPPLTVTGRDLLRAIDWSTPVPSAQVKSAILLAGLRADGTTTVREAVATRDHTERMLRVRGVSVRSAPGLDGGAVIEIEGGAVLQARDELVPGDPSAAAFWLVAGAIHPAAHLRVRAVGVNPTRRAVIDILGRMGASIDEVAIDGAARALAPVSAPATAGDGEPIADLVVRSSALEAIELEPAETAAAIDEIPILCLAATQARGRSVIRGGGELRHKESDRIAGIVDGLTTLGARIEVRGDDIFIDGPTRLRGDVVDSRGDHRLALTFAIAGLIAGSHTTIGDAASVSISYPTFFADLERIRS